MPWYFFSIGAFIMLSAYTICQKWSLNLKIPPKLFLLIYFGSSFLVFSAFQYHQIISILSGSRLVLFLVWGFLVALFSMIGNIFSIKAVSIAPNPAYIKAIESANSMVILFASAFLFGSPLKFLKVLGVILVLFGLFIIIFDRQKAKRAASKLWYLPGLAAMLSFSLMILVTKEMVNLGFKAQEVLLILFFFATINFLIVNKFNFKEFSLKKIEKPKLLVLAISGAMIAGFFANFGHFYAVSVAPNPGYPQAILSANFVLTLILARILLPFEAGGNFEWKKWLGVIVVTGGILTIVLG